MATLTIHNLSEEVLSRLNELARQSNRDIEEEAVLRLTRSVENAQLSASKTRAVKLPEPVQSNKGSNWLTPEFIRDAREEGRA